MTAKYAPRALHDLETILRGIGVHSPQGATNVALAIKRAVGSCAIFPRAAPRTDEPDLHRKPIGKYPYTIFYRIVGDGYDIEIVRVVHSARIRSLAQMPTEDV